MIYRNSRKFLSCFLLSIREIGTLEYLKCLVTYEEKTLLLVYIVFCACGKTGDVQPRLTFPRESRPGMRTECIPVWKLEPWRNTNKRTKNKTVLISCGHQVALHTRCQIQQFFKPGAFFGFSEAETKQNKKQVGPGRGGGLERGGKKKKTQNLPSLIVWAIKTLENPLVFWGSIE